MSNNNRTTDKKPQTPSEPLFDWPNDAGFEATHEDRTPVELRLSGKIPSYAAGTLYRTGPGTHLVPTDSGDVWSASHWFDGFTHVHRFDLQPSSTDATVGKVMYNSRRMCDGVIDSIRKTGKLDEVTFGQKKDPCESLFKKVTSTFQLLRSSGPSVDTADKANPLNYNVGVTVQLNHPGYEKVGERRAKKLAEERGETGTEKHGTRLYNATDAYEVQRFDPETLEPLGVAFQTTLHPDLKGPMSAAHAEHCPVTGDVYNYNLEFGMKPTYRIFKCSMATGKTEILATILDAKPAYIHSLFLTENYIILCVWGSYYAAGGAKVLWTKNIVEALEEWDANSKARWYVIDRTSGGKGLVATYESDPFFCFHSINSFEEDGDVVCDLSIYDNVDVIKKFYYENLKSTAPGAKAYEGKKGESSRTTLVRYRFNDVLGINDSPSGGSPNGKAKKGSKVKTATKDWHTDKTKSFELPTYNPTYTTKRYRYMYGVTDLGGSSIFDGIGKYDADTKEWKRWSTHAQTPGEPIFVANPDGKDEDDGVLLSVVLDGRTGNSYLLCLNAKNLEEVGRAECDWAVGFGFHGLHLKSPL